MGALAGAAMLIFTSGGYVHHVMPPSVTYFANVEECEFAKKMVELRMLTAGMRGDVTVMCLATGGNH